MNLRKRYVFDRHDQPTECKYIQLLAASADERTWWLKGGTRGGVRVLAHFADDGKIHTATRLHASTLVESEQPDAVRCLLRQAANELDPLMLHSPEVLPGFTHDDTYAVWRHESGWFSHSERVLRLPVPWWAPEAKVFDIPEGIYLRFPDETSRLCRRRDYYALDNSIYLHSHCLLARQGDLLFLATGDCVNTRMVCEGWRDDYMCKRTLGDHDIVDLGRHRIDCGEEVVTHPEHGVMDLPTEPWLAMIEPGTSRPFGGNRRD